MEGRTTREARFAPGQRAEPTAPPEPGVGGAAVAPPVADPAPLGLAAFALTTFVLSCFNADLIGVGGEPVVLGLAVAYGGLAQFAAGMWEFRNNNTFGAVAFTSYAAFWLSFAAMVIFFQPTIPTGDVGHAVGLYLIGWGIFTAYMTVPALRTTTAVVAVFALLTATFFLLGIGESANSTTLVRLGGWVGLATAAAAWYASFAAVTNATFGREVMPVGALRPTEV